MVSATFTGHSRYIYSVCYLQPTDAHPDGLFATASVDTMVNLWSPVSEPNRLPIEIRHLHRLARRRPRHPPPRPPAWPVGPPSAMASAVGCSAPII